MPNPKVNPPQPPQFWNQVPKSLWRRLRLEEVFQKALFATGQPDPYGPIIALYSLESYVEAAKRQNRRLKRAMVVPWRPGAKSRSSLFDDTHFYFNLHEIGFSREPTSVETVPEKHGSLQNYPNPFNPATTIEYIIPRDGQVSLTVYNVSGQVIGILNDKYTHSGYPLCYMGCS